MKTYPRIIQGGMGVNISNWRLARTVSMLGEQGTVSGTLLERVLAITLQKGDPGGHVRRALSHFPYPRFVELVMNAYFVEGGISPETPLKRVVMFTVNPPDLLIALTVCANFTFVWLAKEGHDNPVSINYLEKVAMPHIYAITGAMLAGIDIVTMGAGIPLNIPKVIDNISKGENPSYSIPVIGKNITSYTMTFDLHKFFGTKLPEMEKPKFLPIISTNLLATIFTTKLPKGSIYGFVVEEPSAGGHNAPPRNKVSYSEKDYVNYQKLAEMRLPFWIGGSYASPKALKDVLALGAEGIQAGSIFALSEESGMNPTLRAQARKLGFNTALEVKTDLIISPTGYPFKVAQLLGTISEQGVYESRTRICNQGHLVSLYEKEAGRIGYRCTAEPKLAFLKKSIGNRKLEEVSEEEKAKILSETDGRGCLCNGLLRTADLNDEIEPPIVTIGDDVSFLPKLMAHEDVSYSATDAIRYLKSGL